MAGRVFNAAEWEPVQPAPAGRVIDASGWEPVSDAPSAPAAPAVGKGASFFRGLLQGATLGFADEIAGAAESAFTDKTYEQARNESRRNFKAAEDANGGWYMAGDIAGAVGTSLIPGVAAAKGAGAIAKGAKAFTKMGAAKQAAIQSGIAGAGSSEATDAAGVAWDAGKSAAIGAGTGAVMGKIVRGAPERYTKGLVGDITDGATAKMRDKVVGKASPATGMGERFTEVVDTIKANPAIKAAKGDPHKLLPAVDEALDRVGRQLDEVYQKAGAATSGIAVRDVQLALDKVAKGLESNPGTRGLARAVRAQMDDVFETWIAPATKQGDGFLAGEVPNVSAQQVREFAKAVGNTAFFGSPAVTPAAGKAVAQDVWKSLKTLIDKNVDEAAAALGEKGGAAELRALNKQASTLMNMREAAMYRATRESTPSTRARSIIGGGVDLMLAAQDPIGFVGWKGAQAVGKPLARFADERLANLAAAAQGGSTAAQLGQRAIELGLAPAVGMAMHQWVQTRLGGGFEAQPVAP